jgi:hypothetical protein
MKTKNVSGQADVELDSLRYETTSAFTATGGAASYLQVKGNSIYRPYPGNTDSCGGYQRMYSQYRQSYVERAKIEVRLWSATGTASQEPFRLIVIPCTAEQYTVYSAYTNIAALVDVPHAKETLFSPGGTLPRINATAATVQILAGMAKDDGTLAQQNSNFLGTSGADPSPLWYFLVGLQCMAGTTTLNAQIQVRITYWCRWRQPIATAVQQLERNFWGNEQAPSKEELEVEQRAISLAREIVRAESKQRALVASETTASADTKTLSKDVVLPVEAKQYRLADPHVDLDWEDLEFCTEQELEVIRRHVKKRRELARAQNAPLQGAGVGLGLEGKPDKPKST